MKKSLKVMLVCGAAVIIAGGVFFIGTRLFRAARDPKAVVFEAVSNTYGEIVQPEQKLAGLFQELFSGGWRQDVTVGINKLSGSLIPLDASTLSIAEVLTVKNTTRRDADVENLSSTLILQLAATPLAEIAIHSTPEILAFNLPQAFDYYVTLDPRHVVREWDASLLGRYVQPIDGIIMENAFYDYYKRLLFTAPAVWEPADFAHHAAILAESAEYTSAEEGITVTDAAGAERECDSYLLNIPVEAANAFYQAVNPVKGFGANLPDDLIGAYLKRMIGAVNGASFKDSLQMRVYVYNEKISGFNLKAALNVSGEVWDTDATVYFIGEKAYLDHTLATAVFTNGTNTYELTIDPLQLEASNPEVFYSAARAALVDTASGQDMELNWDIRWDKAAISEDNLQLKVSALSEGKELFNTDINGMLSIDYEDKHIDANLKKLTLTLPDERLDASLRLTYILRGDESAILYDTDGSVPLAQLNELDALDMYARVMAEPRIASVINQLAP